MVVSVRIRLRKMIMSTRPSQQNSRSIHNQKCRYQEPHGRNHHDFISQRIDKTIKQGRKHFTQNRQSNQI
jgi:hypothetical protein